MRIRQVKPSFWTDAKIAALDERTRLFFIGTWMLADDAGWFRWEPAEAALQMYGFEARGRRERRVNEMMAELVAAGRVEIYECGHACVLHLRDHQRFAAPDKQSFTVKREHEKCIPAGTRESPQETADVRYGTERIGTSRNGGVAGGLKDKIGTFEAIVGGKAS